jgi:hypothetical protein
VGPGIEQRGVDSTTWADHTDIRPTVLYLAGLDDRYVYDGRVLLEDITPAIIPTTLRPTFATLLQFGEAYKQLTAPLGSFDLASLTASTAALKSKASGDTDYVTTESGLASLGVRRDALAQHMLSLLGNAEFSGVPIPDDQMQLLISQAQTLQEQMKTLATNAQKG